MICLPDYFDPLGTQFGVAWFLTNNEAICERRLAAKCGLQDMVKLWAPSERQMAIFTDAVRTFRGFVFRLCREFETGASHSALANSP